jgi:hypothetical protein
MVFAKNVPWILLLKHLPRLAYGQFYFFLAYRQPLHSLAGYLGFLVCLPHVLRERRKMKRLRRISTIELDGLLKTEMTEPPLLHLLARRIRYRRT